MTRSIRTTLFSLAATVVLAAGVLAVAHPTDEPPKPSHYTIDLGIHGYSPMSYFESGPEPGSPEFAVVHEGVTYFLTDAEQVRKFSADPEKYAPAYGGWCAFGMAVEDHFPIDPESYKIVDGRLMLFLRNPEVDALELWNQQGDRPSTKKADRFWRQAHGG